MSRFSARLLGCAAYSKYASQSDESSGSPGRLRACLTSAASARRCMNVSRSVDSEGSAPGATRAP
jgi:hypothetical protein